jgi:hypothetical protein
MCEEAEKSRGHAEAKWRAAEALSQTDGRRHGKVSIQGVQAEFLFVTERTALAKRA